MSDDPARLLGELSQSDADAPAPIHQTIDDDLAAALTAALTKMPDVAQTSLLVEASEDDEPVDRSLRSPISPLRRPSASAWLADLTSAPAVPASPAAPTEDEEALPEVAPAAATARVPTYRLPAPVWQRHDDDILPNKRSAKARAETAPKHKATRAPKAPKAPKALKPAKAPKTPKEPKAPRAKKDKAAGR